MNEKEVLLPFGKTIYQSEQGQGITLDTTILVKSVLNDFENEKLRVLELGSGNGIISLMLAWYRKNWKVIGVEIQKQIYELSLMNAKKLNLKNVIFLNIDLNDYTDEKGYNLIVVNPPYFPVEKGRISPVKERAIARHELKTNMKKILLTIQKNLLSGGFAYIIYPKERLKEFEYQIKNIDLLTVEKKINSHNLKLVLFRIKKGKNYA